MSFYMNTAAIVNGCGTAGIAARICNDLDLNGYTDWYLPSRDELIEMQMKIGSSNNGFSSFGDYWSSSQDDANDAIVVSFFLGSADDDQKNQSRRVRAIRAFSYYLETKT